MELYDNPGTEWTTRQLRAYIRAATSNLNNEFINLQLTPEELRKDYPTIASQRDKLIELGTGKEFRGGIGMGLTYKTKTELLVQARALRETYNLMDEINTPEDVSKAYESFANARPDMALSYGEYKSLVEIMGAMGTRVLEEFGSAEIVEVYAAAKDSGKSDRNILTAIVETTRESKGQCWTTEELIDSLNNKLGLRE